MIVRLAGPAGRNSSWPTSSSRPMVETLRVAGRIDFDEHRLARIGATMTGRVTEIDAWLGQDVKRGPCWPA